jgi:hypothetical protein
METNLAQLTLDRFGIADTLDPLRFGRDHNDAGALASTFTEIQKAAERPK